MNVIGVHIQKSSGQDGVVQVENSYRAQTEAASCEFLDLLAGICSAVKPCMSMFVVSLFEIHVSLRKIKSYSAKLLKNHNLQFSV